jgi:Spy/CpxP family protein refolding chaperone
MRRLLPWALLAASLAANVGLGVTLARRGQAAFPEEPLIFSKVHLDEGQRQRILSLRSEVLAHREESEHHLETLRGQLASDMAREPVDLAAVESTLRQIAEIQARLQHTVVDHVLAVRAVLRPEQRTAFEEVIAHHMLAGRRMHLGLEPSGTPSPPSP